MRKTKIICTLGPASESEEVIRELMLAGMNVARLNFSHGTHEEQRGKLERVKKVREELGLPVALLLDTKGPEIRTGEFEKGKVELKKGQTFVLTTEDVMGNEGKVSITYKNLVKDVQPGDSILIDDGLIGLKVVKVTEKEIICSVENGGIISNKKGINVPGVELKMPFISKKDKDDIEFAVQEGFDYIAASFTRTADDILEIRRILEENHCDYIKIIAKVENDQGIKNVDEILRVADGVMIARGDMGVEIPLEEVPSIQKKLIRKAFETGKPIITATQMLDSMMKNPRPTRAETSDVANAIYQGTSAIMLSGETASGQYPVEALKTMVKIALRTEADIDYDERFKRRSIEDRTDITNAVSHATCTTAVDLHAAAIITVTKSGRTVGMIAKHHPGCMIIGCCMDDYVCRQLNLYWGVQPLLLPKEENADALFNSAVTAAEDAGLVFRGDLTVLTAGVPLGVTGTTNLIKVQVAGKILVEGKGYTKKKVCGPICVAKDMEELKKNFVAGDIVVVPETTNEMLPELKSAKAVIAEQGGSNSHAAIVGLTLEIPVIVNAANATEILKNGAVVEVDAENGTVSSNS
ncbi:pyruvate kinase [Anaerosacchariphilus sp. NSJ-68]|uniref:Pyruvate kinase n=2 Tax=Lachnospiraceae TaxID=186803 RepID=A0A923LDR5_9FIRM|nr:MULTISPECIES: pyruvate kinase [Lachnospiraceae]MBC5660227.1 pyruvate kinase [Anaerosacchariphilus hominis]MBC5699342.1 pyruvate kinase [Roseburia difficilis]